MLAPLGIIRLIVQLNWIGDLIMNLVCHQRVVNLKLMWSL